MYTAVRRYHETLTRRYVYAKDYQQIIKMFKNYYFTVDFLLQPSTIEYTDRKTLIFFMHNASIEYNLIYSSERNTSRLIGTFR